MICFVKKCLSLRSTATKALLWGSHGVPLHSYRVLGGDSLPSHGAFTAHERRSKHLCCAFRAMPLCLRRVEDTVTSQRTPCSLRAKATDDHSVCTTTLVRAHGVPIALQETLLRGYSDLTASPLRSIRSPSQRRATVFVLSMLKVRAIARHSRRSHRVQWRCHCVAAVMLGFVLPTHRRSFFLGHCGIAVRALPWCDRGLRYCLMSTCCIHF